MTATGTGEGHELQVVGGEVGVVEQAGQEVGRPTGDAEALVVHQLQHRARVPDVDQVDRPVAQHRDQEGVEHPDEVTDRRAGDLGRASLREEVVELAGLAPDRAMGVDDALRVARRARREADHRRGVGVDGGGPGDRFGVEHRRERQRHRGQRRSRRVPHHQPGRHRMIGQDALVDRQEVGVPEAVGSDHDRRPRGAHDVVDLLGAVEVHDRDDHRAEVGGGPEGDGGLDPVG
jgi:hypothetical protein